MIYNVQLSALK